MSNDEVLNTGQNRKDSSPCAKLANMKYHDRCLM